ncbi:MAG TPA: glycerol-3-phosphate dehydrogenase/oxidase [Caulobacteraceae bacterium]
MPGDLDFRDRSKVFAALEADRFDLLVVGGGVTGAGIARDAAMRGLKVALVEARDFASGTSSRSSKMIHGGLRYLAQGDLALVREAASERKAVERIAPHLTKMTYFVVPARNAAGIVKLNAGLWTFEKLGGVAKDRKHESWNAEELAKNEPALRTDDLAGAIVYPEYLTDDARLTLANIRSATVHGAVVASYAPVTDFLTEGGKVVGAVIGDALGNCGARVRAKVVVNAAGPWVDALRRLEDQAAPERLALTKGIHLVLPGAKLPISRTIVISTPDKRSIFAVPKRGMTYIGTTDTFYETPDYWPRIEAADVDYLIEAVAARFTTPKLTRADFTSAWSGVRPLVAEEGKSPSDISRKDEIWTGPHGVLSIAGGKLTAYRQMAQDVVDMAQKTLGQKPAKSLTATTSLVGGDLNVDRMTARLRQTMDEHAAERLVQLYGAEAPEAVGGPEVEARRAVLREGALMLEDYWARRSARAWFDPDGGFGALEPASRVMGELLGWSAQEREQQIAACRAIHNDYMAFQRS